MDNSTCSDLYTPISFGAINAANRIAMAPVMRSRYCEVGIPNELPAEYYGQRASAGLIIAEATNISPQARGYAATPGIWSDEQVAGWKLVTNAVHEDAHVEIVTGMGPTKLEKFLPQRCDESG